MYLLAFYTFPHTFQMLELPLKRCTLSFMTSYLAFVQACPKPSCTVVLYLSMVHLVSKHFEKKNVKLKKNLCCFVADW